MNLLDVQGLNISYSGVAVVSDLSFAIEAGESVGLVGESGSGKSQTALAILGLLPRNAEVSGAITFDGREILAARARELDRLRATRIAMVFQEPAEALNPYLRIGDQLGRILIQHKLAAGGDVKARVIEMLTRVGLADAERQCRAYPHQLSGGMQQRVMIAAALIAKPDLLVADEPTTALDVTVQAQILELLDTLRKDTALLLITHDLGVVAEHTERMLVLEQGYLVESGVTRQVFSNPQQVHTQALLRAAPRLDSGTVPEPITSKTVLAVNGATVSYREAGKKRLTAVRDIEFSVSEGETVAIVGESGSGKSSLVRAILGLIPADAGTVSFYGALLAPDLRARSKSTRRDLQLVFQNPTGSLNPQMRIEAIVSEPLSVHEATLSREKVLARVTGILEQVGLDADYLRRYPHELSGGQAQRVAIARALVLEPKILVCDEAVAALDGSVRQQILELLTAVQLRTGLSILFISHDLGVVRTFSHRVLVMYLGRLVELAHNAALFTSPQHPYTRALIDAVPIPNPDAARQPVKLRGEVPSILSPPDGCAFHPRCRYAEERCSQQRPAVKSAGDRLVACHRSDEI